MFNRRVKLESIPTAVSVERNRNSCAAGFGICFVGLPSVIVPLIGVLHVGGLWGWVGAHR